MRDYRILIAGDLVITKSYKPKLDEQIQTLFNESDFNIVNLECPITEAGKEYKISKTGPHLKGNKDEVSRIVKDLSIDLFTLANNHLRDYGNKGVIDTLAFCEEIDVDYVGAGGDCESVVKSYRNDDNKFVVLNYAENEWGGAEGNLAGASNYNLINIYNDIKSLKKDSLFVILIIHGGNEYYNLPSPQRKKEYRFFAEAGADLIVSHHAHCFSGMEVYQDTPIFYGLGNFLFTIPSKYQEWYTGLTVEITLNEGKLKSWNIIPIVQDNHTFDLSLCSDENNILMNFQNLSQILIDDNKLKEEWNKFAERKSIAYLNHFSFMSYFSNPYIKAIFTKSGLSRILTNKGALKVMLNLMRCEAHSELSKEIITKYLNNHASDS